MNSTFLNIDGIVEQVQHNVGVEIMFKEMVEPHMKTKSARN